MLPYLNNEQLRKFRAAMEFCLHGLEITQTDQQQEQTIDLLASSGMRVGELAALNRDDINFNERECVVFGKGNKERLYTSMPERRSTCRTTSTAAQMEIPPFS